jgi:hypothetical protein
MRREDTEVLGRGRLDRARQDLERRLAEQGVTVEGSEAELRALLLDAHQQLLERDRELMRLRDELDRSTRRLRYAVSRRLPTLTRTYRQVSYRLKRRPGLRS